MAKYGFKYQFNPHILLDPYLIIKTIIYCRTTVALILKLRQLRHREVKVIVQGHKASKEKRLAPASGLFTATMEQNETSTEELEQLGPRSDT